MDMLREEDHAGGDASKDYCLHCCRPDGSMQSFEEKRAGMIEFMMGKQGFDRGAAEALTDSAMRGLPAWSGRRP
jgi:hypothetical protein